MATYTHESGCLLRDGVQIATIEGGIVTVPEEFNRYRAPIPGQLEKLGVEFKGFAGTQEAAAPDPVAEEPTEETTTTTNDLTAQIAEPQPEPAVEVPKAAKGDPEPARDPERGDKDPAYIRWFKANHSAEEFDAKYFGRTIPDY